jgi:hypothetical protein
VPCTGGSLSSAPISSRRISAAAAATAVEDAVDGRLLRVEMDRLDAFGIAAERIAGRHATDGEEWLLQSRGRGGVDATTPRPSPDRGVLLCIGGGCISAALGSMAVAQVAHALSFISESFDRGRRFFFLSRCLSFCLDWPE